MQLRAVVHFKYSEAVLRKKIYNKQLAVFPLDGSIQVESLKSSLAFSLLLLFLSVKADIITLSEIR